MGRECNGICTTEWCRRKEEAVRDCRCGLCLIQNRPRRVFSRKWLLAYGLPLGGSGVVAGKLIKEPAVGLAPTLPCGRGANRNHDRILGEMGAGCKWAVGPLTICLGSGERQLGDAGGCTYEDCGPGEGSTRGSFRASP